MNERSRSMDQSQILIQNYGVWQPPPPREEPVPIKFQTLQRPIFVAARSNWKANNSDKRKEIRRNHQPPLNVISGGGCGSGSGGFGGYKPPNFNDLQSQSRAKNRRFHSRKKSYSRFAPFAPRNTTSFIIRAKKSGGIASIVSPCPVTPAMLPTPMFSPSKEVLVDMAKEEWGVDGYGSMNGLIRLRSPRDDDDDDDEEEGGSSGSDVEEHVEIERRLDHDLSRFEMIYPNYGYEQTSSVLGNRVDDQDTHIAQLEEENLALKERLFLIGSELEDLRRRVHCWETNRGRVRYNNEEASEINAWDNEGSDDVCSDKSVGDGD